MRRVLLMVRKDLLRQVRSPLAILLLLSFPLVFASLLALTFGAGSTPKMPKVQLLVEDLDGSFLSGALISAVTSEQMGTYFDVETVGSEGLGRIERNDGSALWRIPEGFQQELIDGTPVEFELIRNPAQSILPEIAEQGLAVLSEALVFVDSCREKTFPAAVDFSGLLDRDRDALVITTFSRGGCRFGASAMGIFFTSGARNMTKTTNMRTRNTPV